MGLGFAGSFLALETASAQEDQALPATTGVSEQSNHTSPEDSPHHRALRSAIRGAQQDEEILRNILWLVNASDRLYGVRRVAANLVYLLPTLQEISEYSSYDYVKQIHFCNWKPLLRWITDALPADVCPVEAGPGNPNRGDSFKRNPVWADLWECVDARKYGTLLSQLLFAHVQHLYFESAKDPRLGRLAYERYGGDEMWNALPDSTYEAALRVRQLAELRWTSVIARLPNARLPKAYAEALSSVEVPESDNTLSATWVEFRETIRLFLVRANGFGPWPARNPSDRSGFSLPNMTSIASDDSTPGDPDDPDTRGWPDGSIVTIAAPLPEELVQMALECDLDPDELAEQTDYYLTSPPGTTDLRQLAIDREISVRGQYRHIQMQHQLLPFGYDIPAAQEVRCLIQRLDELSEGLGDVRQWDQLKLRTAEIVALIQIQLWYGVSLKRARSLVTLDRCNGALEAARIVAEGTLIYSRSDSEWIVPVDSPPYRRVFLDPAEQAHAHLRWLPLPDLAGGGRSVSAT